MHKTNVIKAIAVMERGDAKYVRADIHEEILEKQSKAAIAGMDAAKLAASKMEKEAKRLYAECNPQALESEREANAVLTDRVAELERMVKVLRGSINSSEMACIKTLVGIIFACRDDGKRMQGELVEFVGELSRKAEQRDQSRGQP